MSDESVSETSSTDEKLQTISAPSQIRSLNDIKLEYFDLVLPNFSACRKRGDYCDVNLKVGENVYKCHRLLLAANSPYFVSLFKNDFKEGEEEIKVLPDEYVDEKSFSKLLNAMYDEPFEIEDDLVPLFTTSVYLQLTHFIDRLQRYIIKNLEVIDPVEILMLPEVQMNKELYTLVKKHVCRNFPKLNSRMAVISLEIFDDLFKDPELFVTSKDQVLDFGKKWISLNVQKRKIHLQKVASLLKPFHAPSHSLLELVNNLVKHLRNDYDVKIALNTLLEFSGDVQNEHKEEIANPLFFVQPNNESGILFCTYKDNAWVFLNEFQLPIATDLLIEYEGAVANDMVYLCADCHQTYCDSGVKSNVIFHGLVGRTRKWVELISPRSMPVCLVTCNRMVYSYEHSRDDYQISVFEPFLNRWLKVPAVNYPRTFAGVASNGHVLYMVGGIPLKQIASTTPTNIVEMYDGRCGNWSRIRVSDDRTILNQNYNKLVCSHKNMLYMVEENKLKLLALDIRNNAWLSIEKLVPAVTKPAAGHLIMVDQKLWFVNEDATKGIHLFNDTGVDRTISNPNVFLKPISLLDY